MAKASGYSVIFDPKLREWIPVVNGKREPECANETKGEALATARNLWEDEVCYEFLVQRLRPILREARRRFPTLDLHSEFLLPDAAKEALRRKPRKKVA